MNTSSAPQPAASKFLQAFALHQAGRLEEAREAYRHVLQLQPEHIQALKLLGTLAFTMNDPIQALELFSQVLCFEPQNAEVYVMCGNAHAILARYEIAIAQYDQAIALDGKSNAMPYYCRGNALHELKRYEAAIASYDQALALESDLDGVAWHGRGAALLEFEEYLAAIDSFDRAIALGSQPSAQAHLGRARALMKLSQWPEALESCDRALALEPRCAEALSARITIQWELKLWEAALSSCHTLIALTPNSAEAFYNRGVIEAQLQNWPAALVSYDSAIVLNPNHAAAFSNRSVVLFRLKRWGEALESCERANSLNPTSADAFLNRGVVQAELRQWEAALLSYERAIALDPTNAAAFSNRGTALAEIGHLEEALASCARAVALEPDSAEAFSNRGIILADNAQWQQALASYDRAIALRPDYADAHVNRSVLWLLLGEFAKGWREYEWRAAAMDRLDSRRSEFSQPRWSGDERIAGKSILLHSEQGLGDTLQFCRYAKLVADLGAQVILGVQEPLLTVLSSLAGVSHVLPRDRPLPSTDLHCPLMSLPLVFQTDVKSIPSATRYLKSQPGKIAEWEARLGGKNKPRLGLVWSGNPDKPRDRNRSIALSDLVAHLPEGFQFVSLQKEIRESDQKTLRDNPQIYDCSSGIRDFADTAALCDCMDLVISVDTSVAHLSAALGRTTWILLPFRPDWRWLLDRSDSPWYPTARLYRQEAPGNWHTTLTCLGRDLAARIGTAP